MIKISTCFLGRNVPLKNEMFAFLNVSTEKVEIFALKIQPKNENTVQALENNFDYPFVLEL